MILRLAAAFLFVSGLVMAEEAACGDLLADLHKKPQHLAFEECKPRPNRQGKPLQAMYRVKGVDAAGVEQYLSKNFGMKPLTKNCCLWESGESTFQARHGRVYYLSMYSGETLIETRSEWGAIPYFTVEFSRETEEP